MKISLLLRREPFGEIFCRTVEKFYQEQNHKSYSSKWFERNPGIKKIIREGFQPWLCNPNLNIIYSPLLAPSGFSPVKKEFSVATKFWKKHPQKMYVWMATTPGLQTFFAQSAFGIKPALSGEKEVVFIGGNNRIRILNHMTGDVHVVLKSGFPSAFIHREIEFRRKYGPALPVPMLKNIGKENNWFTEEYISGTPLNRLTSKKFAQEKFIEACNAIHRLLNQTKESILLQDYVESLCTRIKTNTKQIRLINSHTQKQIYNWVEKIHDILFAYYGKEEVLTVAEVHGDFQDANILVTENDLYLIDWEYSGRRQIGYDALVYSLRSRFPKGLTERVRRLKETDKDPRMCLFNWPELEWENSYLQKKYLLVFFLEELDLYLQENNNPNFFSLTGGLYDFLVELKPLLKLFP